MVPLRNFRFFGGEVTVFSRPSIRIEGNDGGWITSAGLSLVGSTDVLRFRPEIDIRGSNAALHYTGRMPGIKAELELRGCRPRPIPARLTAEGDYYRLVLVVPQDVPPCTTARIHVSFDTFFVPSKIGLNGDARELVMMAPLSVTCRAAQTATARR
jgi:hypothetical protein